MSGVAVLAEAASSGDAPMALMDSKKMPSQIAPGGQDAEAGEEETQAVIVATEGATAGVETGSGGVRPDSGLS